MTEKSELIRETSTEDKRIFIFDNINELSLQDRIAIVQIIYNSSDRGKLKEKGSGVQIKLNDVSQSVLNNLYAALIKKLKEQTLDLA